MRCKKFRHFHALGDLEHAVCSWVRVGQAKVNQLAAMHNFLKLKFAQLLFFGFWFHIILKLSKLSRISANPDITSSRSGSFLVGLTFSLLAGVRPSMVSDCRKDFSQSCAIFSTGCGFVRVTVAPLESSTLTVWVMPSASSCFVQTIHRATVAQCSAKAVASATVSEPRSISMGKSLRHSRRASALRYAGSLGLLLRIWDSAATFGGLGNVERSACSSSVSL